VAVVRIVVVVVARTWDRRLWRPTPLSVAVQDRQRATRPNQAVARGRCQALSVYATKRQPGVGAGWHCAAVSQPSAVVTTPAASTTPPTTPPKGAALARLKRTLGGNWFVLAVAVCLVVLLVLAYLGLLPAQRSAGRSSTTPSAASATARPPDMSHRRVTAADLGGGLGLADAAFAQSALDGLVLDGLDLRGAVFAGASLRGASLIGARLQGADLTNADLRSADLTGADLSGADLTGACLRAARFERAALSGVLLRGAVYDPAQFQGARSQPLVPAGATAASVAAAVAPTTSGWCA
jgi:hypothetical protein